MLSNTMTEMTETTAAFTPSSEFRQTCGFCGCVFRVEVERARSHKDVQEYRCPECHDHVCLAKTSTPPRVTLISNRTDGREVIPSALPGLTLTYP